MDIWTPPISPLPDQMNGPLHDTPRPIAMLVAQRPMVSFSQQQDVQPQNPQNEPSRDTGRVLVLCFDGTGNKFGEVGVNVRFQRPSIPNLFTESMGI